jgi:predicted DNA-binding transcriptional regulator AlpA
MNTSTETRRPALPDRLLDTGDLAKLFGVSRDTVLRWSDSGAIPPGRRFGRVIRWTADDIRPLLAERGA